MPKNPISVTCDRCDKDADGYAGNKTLEGKGYEYGSLQVKGKQTIILCKQHAEEAWGLLTEPTVLHFTGKASTSEFPAPESAGMRPKKPWWKRKFVDDAIWCLVLWGTVIILWLVTR